MKKLIYCLQLTTIIITLTQSCKKSKTNEPERKTINVTLKNTDTYQFDLGAFGDEEGAGITKQAMHYQVSAAGRSANDSRILYTYMPVANYVGEDEVVIESARGSDGASANHLIVYTIIKFIIIN